MRASLRSSEAFTLRRSQILLASTKGQMVRNVIRAFEAESVVCLEQKSSRPKTAKPKLDAAKWEQLRGLLHQSQPVAESDRAALGARQACGGST